MQKISERRGIPRKRKTEFTDDKYSERNSMLSGAGYKRSPDMPSLTAGRKGCGFPGSFAPINLTRYTDKA